VRITRLLEVVQSISRMLDDNNRGLEGITASRPQFYASTGNLVVAIEVAVLLGIRPTRPIGIWTFDLDALAFETHCFHEYILLSFVSLRDCFVRALRA